MIDEALIGTWLLRSHQVVDRRTGGRFDPFGAAPSGVLMLAASGRMVALITPGTETTVIDKVSGRPQSSAPPPPLIAYSGRYRAPTSGIIVTTVDVASIAAWVGTDQERAYTLVGDRLELTTPQVGDGDMAAMVATMVWARETSAVASGGASD